MENEPKWDKISVGEETNTSKSFLYCISNYLWILFLCIFLVYYRHVSHYQDVQVIKSFNRLEKWNSSYNPHILGFISDAHITSFFPEDINITMTILQILNDTNVEKILIAGDIGDNFATRSSIKHGQQYEEDYIISQKIFEKYPSDLFIIASGNHDEFGVESYNSSDHYILKYCDFYSKNDKFKNYDNFLISKVDYEDIEIFVMNPYHYPTVRAGLGYYSNLTREMLNKIELALSSPSHSKSRFLLTHFPLSYTNTWAKSSTHKSLIDIATSSNITAVLSGHSHHELIIHRKSSLEIRPRSMKSGKNSGGGYRYITIDNGDLSDHGFILNKDKKPLAVLTHPVKKKLVNHKTDFSYQNFEQSEIRVVRFSEDSDFNVSVSCSSSSNGFSDKKTDSLKFQRVIRNGQSLYSIPLKKLCYRESDNNKKDYNEYRLSFSGDWSYESEFVVGDSVKLDKEILDNDVNMRECVIAIGITCWIVIIFIWCPFPSFKYFDKVSALYADQSSQRVASFEYSLFDQIIGLIFGFFVIKSRIYHNIPKWIQYVYFAIVLSPFFVPISLMKIGKSSYGFIYFLGYYLNGFAFDLWGGQLTSYFVLLILLPSTLVFSAISYLIQTKKWNYFFIIDIATFVLQFLFVTIPITKALYQSTSLVFSLTSPLFALFPIVIIVIEIIIVVRSINSSVKNIFNNDKKHFLYDDVAAYY